MKKTVSIVGVIGLLLALSGAASASVRTVRVSVRSSGEQSNCPRDVGWAYLPYRKSPSISANGRFVAFPWCKPLTRSARKGQNIFVHNLRSGKTRLASVSSSGRSGNRASRSPSISGNGRWVAFESAADNLVRGDTNADVDVFAHNMRTGRTKLVSVSSLGEQGSGTSPSISRDGHKVAFLSSADNLVANDNNGAGDIFIHNIRSGKTKLVTITDSGEQANGSIRSGMQLSGNGRRVVFESSATNLVAGDTPGGYDVFVHSLRTGRNRLVPGSSNPASQYEALPSISGNGRRVVYQLDGCPSEFCDPPEVAVYLYDLHTGETSVVTSQGFFPEISADGHQVVFLDGADFWLEGYVHSMDTGRTTTVGVTMSGEASGKTYTTSIDADGSRVAFISKARNLVKHDTNGAWDFFVRGRFHHR